MGDRGRRATREEPPAHFGLEGSGQKDAELGLEGLGHEALWLMSMNNMISMFSGQ